MRALRSVLLAGVLGLAAVAATPGTSDARGYYRGGYGFYGGGYGGGFGFRPYAYNYYRPRFIAPPAYYRPYAYYAPPVVPYYGYGGYRPY